jgi:hypothetical protein
MRKRHTNEITTTQIEARTGSGGSSFWEFGFCSLVRATHPARVSHENKKPNHKNDPSDSNIKGEKEGRQTSRV